MTLKTRLTLSVAIGIMGISVAACKGPASPTNAATAQPPTASLAQPSPTALLPTDTSLPPTDTLLPPTSTPTSLPPTAPPSAEVVVKLMNLRAGPNTSYPIVAVLKEGDSLTVLGRSPDSLWIAVKTADGLSGWCSAQSKYVRLSADANSLAVMPVPPPPAGGAVTTARPQAASPVPAAVATQAPADTQVPPTQAPPAAEALPAPASQQFILYFYFGAEGCPYSRQMAPLIQQFYQQYFPSPQLGAVSWDIIGIPVGWWGGDPAAFRGATGVTFPFAGDPGLSVDTSQIPVTVVVNKQTGVYRTATVGAVSYGTLVNQTTLFASGSDIGANLGTS